MQTLNIKSIIQSVKDASEKKILRTKEAAAYVGLSRSTVYGLIQMGKFVPVILLGARARGYLRTDLDAWIESRIDAGKVTA